MPNDYINPADGLLYCGECHTPRQCKVRAFGVERVQFCTCECEQKRLAGEEAERERQQRLADKRRRERSIRARSKQVDLTLELSDGTRGHIKGKISSKE